MAANQITKIKGIKTIPINEYIKKSIIKPSHLNIEIYCYYENTHN